MSSSFRSQYGPKYKAIPNFYGWTATHFTRLGLTAGAFGGVAGVAAVFFLNAVPRMQKDVLQKIPVIGGYFVHEIPASDNPF